MCVEKIKKIYLVYEEDGYGNAQVAEVFSSRNAAREYVIDVIFSDNRAYQNKEEDELKKHADNFIFEYEIRFNWR